MTPPLDAFSSETVLLKDVSDKNIFVRPTNNKIGLKNKKNAESVRVKRLLNREMGCLNRRISDTEEP